MATTDERLRKLINRRVPSRLKKPRKRRKTKDENEIDVTRLDELSETELVAIAHQMGFETVSRQIPAEDIIDIILGGVDSPQDPLLPVREGIHDFVQKNEIMVASLPCDLDCPNCTHHWVVECFTDNRDLVDVDLD
jgi:hypothetical protein